MYQMSLINVTSLSYSPSLFLCDEKTNLLTFSRGPLENPKLVWGQKKYLEFDLRKCVKNMKDFEHLMKGIIMKQYLFIHLTKVAIKDFKGKYRGLHNSEQSLALLLLRTWFT